jgi:hypothetical protein
MVRLLILLIIAILTNPLVSQNYIDNSDNEDPIKLINENVSLISEYNYYEATLLKKTTFENGYGYKFKLKISDSCFASAFIVSAKEKIEVDNESINKLEVGKSYHIKLIDYFEQPIPLGIETKYIYDVLLGSDKISVLTAVNGNLFSKIYISPNIIDKYYFNPSSDLTETNFTISTDVKKFIFEFTRSISFIKYSDNDSLKFLINKFQLKKSLTTNYLNVISLSPSHKYNSFSRTIDNKLPKRHPNKKLINFSKLESFKKLFSRMLTHYYNLPVADSENFIESFTINDIFIKPLYHYNNLLTVKLTWHFKTSEDYVAIISIKNNNGNYRIIRFEQLTRDFYDKL